MWLFALICRLTLVNVTSSANECIALELCLPLPAGSETVTKLPLEVRFAPWGESDSVFLDERERWGEPWEEPDSCFAGGNLDDLARGD